ncbi:TRAF-interacting protein with FHA domain-containing protein A [Brachionichthys hirsutus]|uniref:TRAF-interacting protein with FHA domain-containing protein A n=1 Tax=Brachionichthys hirsutus TaxID=412623 RepID=UPI00360444B6
MFFSSMNVSQKVETEEDLLTYLRIKLYHPQQNFKGLFALLPLGNRKRHAADDSLKLGRDSQTCAYALVDARVSRKQLSLQAYRTPHSQEMLFAVQNLSQKGRMSVNGVALGYLERMELPDKALIRFGEYEMLVVREPGEAKGSFEVEFEVLAVSPFRETCVCVPSTTPVKETSSCFSYSNGLRVNGPLETDETITFQS